MATLGEHFGQGQPRQKLINDACEVLDAEVADKGGLSGVAIKGAYKVVKGIKPGFVREVIDGLLDDFLQALDPIYQEAVSSGTPAGKHLVAKSDDMAERLLGITDARAEKANRQVVKKTYEKLRPSAKKHVVAAAPRLGGMLDRNLASL